VILLALTILSIDLNSRFIEVEQIYEPVPETEELYFQLPFSVAFHENGDMYVLDTRACKIHVWDKNGKYLRYFGKTGAGPGEISRPAKIDITGDALWVFDHSGRRLTKLDLYGKLITTVTALVRADKFAALNDNLFLTAYKRHSDDARTVAAFDLFDENGRIIKNLKEFDHGGYIIRKGETKEAIKAFGPDMHIQRIAQDRWIFGFSQNTSLFEVNNQGEIVSELKFEMFTEPPTDTEIAFHKKVNFPTQNGTRGSFERWKHLEFAYEYDKAYYTSFTKLPDDKIVFALTPIGGFGSAAGFHQATYFVNDWNTRKIVDRGFYEFPQDSIVFFEAGRIIVFEVDEEGEYIIKRVHIKPS